MPLASNFIILRSGAVAGATSALVFTAIHDVLISDIWFSLVPMMAAGALCGLCVAWTYHVLFARPTPLGWATYNLLYVFFLVLLGAGSVLFFEPVTSMAAVLAANAPPRALIEQAAPFTAAFTLGSAVLICVVWARTLRGIAAVGVTWVILVALLGLNVSALGLVALPLSAAFLIAELFVLIFVLDLVYVFVFWLLERTTLFGEAARPCLRDAAG